MLRMPQRGNRHGQHCPQSPEQLPVTEAPAAQQMDLNIFVELLMCLVDSAMNNSIHTAVSKALGAAKEHNVLDTYIPK